MKETFYSRKDLKKLISQGNGKYVVFNNVIKAAAVSKGKDNQLEEEVSIGPGRARLEIFVFLGEEFKLGILASEDTIFITTKEGVWITTDTD